MPKICSREHNFIVGIGIIENLMKVYNK